MAAIQNERDKLLQAAPVRFILPTIPTSQVDGLDNWMGGVNDALDGLGQDIEHLMNTSSAFSIRANGLVFTNTAGTTTPSTITLTAARGEGLAGGTVEWSVFAGSATLSTATGESTIVTGSTVSGRSVTVRARLTVAGVNHDAYVTITRLGAIAASNVVSLTSQVTGQLANSNVSGLGALALLNVVDLNSQTVGALNGLTQVTNLGNLAYANAIAANQIGAGTLAAGVIYSGVVNASQVNSGSFVGKTFTGGTFTGALFKSVASGRRVEIDAESILFYPLSGARTIVNAPSNGGLSIIIPSGANGMAVGVEGTQHALTVAGGNVGIVISSGGPSLRLTPKSSLPSDRSLGNVCVYGGWLCFANGSHWFQSDGTQLT